MIANCHPNGVLHINLFIWGFGVNTVQVISRLVVFWAEETSTYSWSRLCTINCRSLVSNYQLSEIRFGFEPPTSKVGGECVATVAAYYI